MSSIISVKDLTFEYSTHDDVSGEERVTRAIDGVSFDVEKGSFVAIAGMNGSGKSTLAKCLNGLLLPSSGDVTVMGYNTRDDETIWDLRSNIAMVFQNPDNQIVSSLVEDDVAFGPENLGIDPAEIRTRVDEALKAVGMYENRRKGAHQLSGGQKQRVAIAGAVAMRPECIVFDEPTAMLDPQGRERVMEIIKQLNGQGITTILITHFMEEAAQAQRIIVMKKGRIFADASPAQLFSENEKLREAGLEKPSAVILKDRLNARGLNIDSSVISGEQLTDWIANQKGLPEGVVIKAGQENDDHDSGAGHEGKSGKDERREYAVRAEHLRYVYAPGLPDETVALDDISFSIPKGAFTGIIGHTGSGKSTLLQHLNGLLHPASGRICIGNTCITDGKAVMTEIRKKVGLVFQYPEYQLFEETVAKDVAFGPKNLGIQGDDLEKVVRRAVEMTGLNYEEVKDRSPFELSGGQKRRVAIAGVLAMEPEVVILDEPTAGLDPAAHREILEMVRHIHETTGNTMIFVSHNMGDIQELADQVLVIDKGRLKYEGSPEEVFSHGQELKNIGLGVPPAMEIMMNLKEKIPEVRDKCMTYDQAETEILRYLEGKAN
ncbi:energy-coupling factor transporter ATPase [Baileyella intestinalis]|uniref:energy-coupling factor transporter ATPase n=1 Tax=Baileyella intestinalis TaxID=2606709 RepID=UPI0022DEE270|nr:energy-coupling factor transporter ATPase [Baileyella intestinalis]